MNCDFKKQTCLLMGISEEEFDLIYAKPSFRGIRINPLKTSFDVVKQCFKDNLKKTPFYKDEYYIPPLLSGVGNLPLHHSGGFYVQEPSASSVLSVVDAQPFENILDLCAAPGGKSTGIGVELKGNGILWSNEYVRKRAGALLSNIERMGIGGAAVSSLDSKYLCESLSGFFNKVLVDAPCSGEGMWRHNSDLENEWSLAAVEECATRQKEILSNASKAVMSGGRLIYSTCTFNKKENEEVVIWFLENHPQFELEKINLKFGREGLSGREDIDSSVKRIFPIDGGEGHFIASFKRIEDGNTYFGGFVQENISASDKKLVLKFLEENFEYWPEGNFVVKNNFVYIVPQNMPDIKGDILRMGLFVGEIRKARIEPSHALFASFSTKPKRVLNLELNDERVEKFLMGSEITSEETENGFVGISVCGCPLGFGKHSSGRITNRYPKGLRLLK